MTPRSLARAVRAVLPSILVGTALIVSLLAVTSSPTADAAGSKTTRTITLTAKKATYVSKSSPKKAYGKKSTLLASKSTYATYLEFGSIKLAAGESISSATLQFYVGGLTGKKKAKVAIASVEKGWSATKLTYKKRPKVLASKVSTAKTVKAKKIAKISLNLSKVKKTLGSGAAFRITNSLSGSSLRIAAKGSKAPKLVVKITRSGSAVSAPVAPPTVKPTTTPTPTAKPTTTPAPPAPPAKPTTPPTPTATPTTTPTPTATPTTTPAPPTPTATPTTTAEPTPSVDTTLPTSELSTLKLTSPAPAGALYVSTGGSDSGPGTSAQPLKTLAKALSTVKAGQTIVLRQGVYREGATGYRNGGTYYHTDLPKNVTIRAYPGETVFFDGTVVVSASDWQKASEKHYTASWSTPDFCAQAYYSRSLTSQTSSGPCAYSDAVDGTTVLGDPQMVFRNDQQLSQVSDVGKLAPDTFYYDWKNKVLHIGFNPEGSTVAATKYAQVAAFHKPEGLTIQGIGFRRYASNQYYNATAGALLLNSGSKVTLDRVVFTENAGAGLQVWQSSNLTIRRSFFSNNGANGFNFSGSAPQLASNSALKDNLVVENTRVERNNTESFGVECTYACSSAGAKMSGMVGATIRYSSFSDNGGGRASGLWCDLDCRDVKIYGNRIVGNARHGVVYEVSDRGVIASNLILNNGWGVATHGGGYGIFSGSANTRIYNNTIIDNKMGVFIFDDPRSPGSATGYDHTKLGPDSRNVEFVNNILSTGKASSVLLRVSGGSAAIATNTSATQVLSRLDYNSYAKSDKVAGIQFLNWQEYTDKPAVSYRTLSELRAAQGAAREASGQLVDSAANPHVKAASSGDYTTKADLPVGAALPADIATLVGASSTKAVPRGVTRVAG